MLLPEDTVGPLGVPVSQVLVARQWYFWGMSRRWQEAAGAWEGQPEVAIETGKDCENSL